MHQTSAFHPTSYLGNRGTSVAIGDRGDVAMARQQHAHVLSRTMIEVVEDALVMLREDVSEYAFIGLAGGACAGIVVLLLGLIGGPIAIAGIAPALVVIAAVALAASSAAIGAGVSRLQPDASRALAEAARRGLAILRPWLPLAVVLGAASYVAALIADHLDLLPPGLTLLAFLALSGAYALPRSLFCTALFEYDLSLEEALATSAAVARAMKGPVVTAWCVALAPALIITALGAITGIDAISGAIAATLLVGSMPVGAALMSLLFHEAASTTRRA
jgi:hypothetical protein